MIQIRDLSLVHTKDFRVLLEHFDLVLNEGDKAVIIGEEGNGKSTLLKWMENPAMIEDYIEWSGTVSKGKERTGYLPQQLDPVDRRKSLYEFFMETPAFFEQTPKEIHAFAGQFHVDPEFFYSDQIMDTLSGGEKIKAQLIRILMDQPTVLLLDEPSNDIDISTLKLLEKLISEWKGIVLFISHDEVLIENTANMIIHIEQIRRKTVPRYTIRHMSYQEYINDRNGSFERQQQMALSDRREKRIRDEKYRRVMQSVEHAQAVISRQDPHAAKNLKDKMHAVKSMGRRFEKEDENMTEMPEQEEAIGFILGEGIRPIPEGKVILDYSLDQLTAGEEERILAENIRLFVKGPQKVCIIGDNGTGKTTLLKKIADVLKDRTDIKAEYMPQNYEDLLNPDMTPVEYLQITGDKDELTWIRTCLGSMKYTASEMEHPLSELSGGQKAKVFLLKMSHSGADVLLLDEPTRNFSPLSNPVIRSMIADFPGTVISISHDRKYIREVSTEVYRLTSQGLVKAENI